MVCAHPDVDIEATNYLMNEGYKSRVLIKKPKKKRKEEFKVNDFVDSRKAIDGSSSESQDELMKARSKAAREDLESEVPVGEGGGARRKQPTKIKVINKKTLK